MNRYRCIFFLFGQSKRIVLGIAFVILFSFGLSAQVNLAVDIQTTESSLSSLNIWTINVVNSTPNYFSCYLHAVVSVPGEGVVGEGVSKAFKLLPYRSVLRTNNTQAVFDSVNINYTGSYRDGIAKTGELPSRSYTVCVELVSVFNGNLITKTCIDKQIQKYQPPVNVFPFDKDTISSSGTNFQWLPVQPLNNNFTYSIRIVELLSIQTKISSLFSNNYFFSQDNIPSTIFQYPVNSRKLEPGRMYSWIIEAKLDELVLKSEPTVFVVEKKPDSLIVKADSVRYIQYIDTRNSSRIPVTKVADKTLRLIIYNQYGPYEAVYCILNSRREILEKKPLTLKAGLNKVSVPVTQKNKNSNEIFYCKIYSRNTPIPEIQFTISDEKKK